MHLGVIGSVFCYYIEYLSVSGSEIFISSSPYVNYNKQTNCVNTEIKKPERLISSLPGWGMGVGAVKFNTTVIATQINQEHFFEFSLTASKCNFGV